MFLQFTSRLHLHTASQEVHFEVDHCDHCLSAGSFHSSQDQPESCHYLINKSRVCCHDGKTKAISHCPEFFEPLNYKLAKKICLVCMRCKIFVCKESYKMLMKAISGAKSFAKNQKRSSKLLPSVFFTRWSNPFSKLFLPQTQLPMCADTTNLPKRYLPRLR